MTLAKQRLENRKQNSVNCELMDAIEKEDLAVEQLEYRVELLAKACKLN